MLPCIGCWKRDECPHSAHSYDLAHRDAHGVYPDGTRDDWVEAEPEAVEAQDGAVEAQDGETHAEGDAPWLAGLNPDQFDVACHLDGPCLVIAGAGSGKTRSIVGRVQTLVRWYRVDPNEILAITFTRKAAREMRDRIHGALEEDEGRGIQIRTFHSTGVRVCRSWPDLLGLRPRFSVWDERASKRAFKEILSEVREDMGGVLSGLPQPAIEKLEKAWTPARVLGLLNKRKEEGERLGDDYWRKLAAEVASGEETLTEKNVRAELNERLAGARDEVFQAATLIWINACKEYERLKSAVNVVDLADLIWLPVVRARENPELRHALSQRWRYVIVDEYQDTNRLQEEFLELVAGEHRNLMVVGDDDQAIYGWRGGDVRLITGFERRWEARVIHLGQNYRCRPEIVEIADRAIRRNGTRVSKKLWSERGAGGAVDTRWFYSGQQEVDTVARMIRDRIEAGVPGEEIAVLTRRRRKVAEVAKALTREKIPVEAVGVRPWYEADDVVTLLALLRYQGNPRDVDAARTVLAAWPKIGPATITAWWASLRYGPAALDKPLRDLFLLPRHGSKTQKGRSLQRLIDLNDQLTSALKQGVPLPDVVQVAIEGSGVRDAIKKQAGGNQRNAEEAQYREVCLDGLVQCAGEVESRGFAGLEELSDSISTLISVQNVTQGRVTVSTIHSAKGLEWDEVIVPACDQHTLPSGDNTEEERRLFYVAATRAKEGLTFTWAIQTYTNRGELVTTGPSPFLRESGLCP